LLVISSAATQHKDSYNRTPLHYAARGGRVSILDYLVDLGLDLFSLDAKEYGVLCYTSSGSHDKVIIAVLNKGLTVSLENAH
jgi:ankyrin repeat protein